MNRYTPQLLWQDIQAVHNYGPLVHNITNWVVMNSSANILLACGASPLMAHAEEEVEEICELSAALVVNMGTLDKNWLAGATRAWRKARTLNRPVIFDPVGVGASTYRTASAIKLLELGATVIRGNASEIAHLAKYLCGSERQKSLMSKGVDATVGADAVVEDAADLARHTQAVVVMSGATDHIISSAGDHLQLQNGDPWMCAVTGTGCGCTALVGACCAVQANYFQAAAAAMAWMGVAGEQAAVVARGRGVGTFSMAFLDQLQLLNESDFYAKVKMA